MYARTLRIALVLALAGSIGLVLTVTGGGDAARQTAPANTAPPTISGEPFVDRTLTATTGTWTGTAPITFTYAWQRCDGTGGGCVVVAGATTASYPLEPIDARSTIRVQVTGTNADGSMSSTSVPTAVIESTQTSTGCPPAQGTGNVSVNEFAPPARLLVDRKSITPAVVTRSTQSIKLRFHVVACDARDVVGALVYATPTPYQQFAETEAATGADGWATLTMPRLRYFPVSSRQQLLIVFVRARKPGEDLLGGISSRRLVSFPVRLSG
jgi:hypothetical protein